MGAAVQDVLEIVVTDWRPSRVEAREAIRIAVLRAAADRHGLVTIAGVRRHLPPWVARAQIGAVMNLLVRRGYLVPTGRTEPNGDHRPKARNASKPTPVRRLVKPIPAEALR